MFYPGLEGQKIDDLSEEDIAIKISEIQKRIGIAYQLGRTDAVPQLNALAAHYQAILQEKFQREEQEMIDADPKLGRTVIDIDWPDPAEEDDQERF